MLKKMAALTLSCLLLAAFLITPAMAADLSKDIVAQTTITSSPAYEGYGPYNVTVDSANDWAPEQINYHTKPETMTDWIMFEFDSPVWINTIILLPRGAQNDQVKRVKIEFDDGTSFENSDFVMTDENKQLENEIRFSAKQVKTIKISIIEGLRPLTAEGADNGSRFGFNRVWILETSAPGSGSGSGSGSAKTADSAIIWVMAGLAVTSAAGFMITKKYVKVSGK